MNIRYVLFRPGERPLDHRDLRHMYSGEMRVFQYVKQAPRAFFVQRYEMFSSPRAVLLRLVSPDFDPGTTVLLEKQSGLRLPNQADASTAEVKVLTYRPEHVRVQVESSSGGVLVLSDSYYPGWEATVNDEKAEILRANFLFRAVMYRAGEASWTFATGPGLTFWGGLRPCWALPSYSY